MSKTVDLKLFGPWPTLLNANLSTDHQPTTHDDKMGAGAVWGWRVCPGRWEQENAKRAGKGSG